MTRTSLLATLPLAAFYVLNCAHGATPYLPEELQLRVVLDFSADSGISPSSTFNPRFFDGDVYFTQINVGAEGFARYPSGANTPTLMVDNHGTSSAEHRMVAPFRGAHRATYLLGSSSGQVTAGTFARYRSDGTARVEVSTPGAQPGTARAEGWDWVDDNTIIYSDYASGARKRLHLADVSAEPFAVTLNTAWNANGYVETGVSTRIRNVRVGDQYPGYAYYGDSGNNDFPKFFAINLATGQETLLGDAGILTGTGSFGVWTVLERGGYLYVQTTDNGILVYPMTGPTSIGPIYTTYQEWDLDLITGYTAQYYGLDVSPDGRRLVLGASGGKVYELGPPTIGMVWLGNSALVTWPSSVTSVILQSSGGLSGFVDMDPQPPVQLDGKANTALVVPGPGNTFYRLRKAP